MTAVEWLAERYNYITWMRNRDEISAGTADKWRAKFLQEAKEMEQEQLNKAVKMARETEYPGVVDIIDYGYDNEMISPYLMDTQNDVDWCNVYQRGYNQALEDNKDRKYTEEDVICIVEKSRETGLTAEYLITLNK